MAQLDSTVRSVLLDPSSLCGGEPCQTAPLSVRVSIWGVVHTMVHYTKHIIGSVSPMVGHCSVVEHSHSCSGYVIYSPTT